MFLCFVENILEQNKHSYYSLKNTQSKKNKTNLYLRIYYMDDLIQQFASGSIHSNDQTKFVQNIYFVCIYPIEQALLHFKGTLTRAQLQQEYGKYCEPFTLEREYHRIDVEPMMSEQEYHVTDHRNHREYKVSVKDGVCTYEPYHLNDWLQDKTRSQSYCITVREEGQYFSPI